MIDIQKQIAYWRKSAEEDWSVGQTLVSAGKIRHGLFFLHLAMEKMLKAHVCKATLNLAPRLHSLVQLAEMSKLRFSEAQMNALADLNRFNLAGRYPDMLAPGISQKEAFVRRRAARGVFQWLKNQL